MLLIFFRPQHEVFFLLAHERRLLAIHAFQPAVLSPLKAELHAPTRMHGREQRLANAVVEYPAQQFERAAVVAQAVAVGKMEHLAVNLGGKGLVVHRHATLLLQVVVSPNVVVAREEVHLDAHIGQLRQLAEEAGETLWHHIFIFIPEVEHVAKEVNGRCLVLDGVEKSHQPALLHPAVRHRERTEVRV